MKKTLFSLILLTLSLVTIKAQTTNSAFLRLGGAFTDFQDVKYSQVPYNGVGLVLNLGFEKENARSIWEAGIAARGGLETASTHDFGAIIGINGKAYFRYLRKVNDRLSIGGHWDVLGLTFRNTSGLGNNGLYYLSSSDLLAAANYKHNKFDFGLDLGILSFVQEGTSFAFSAPQSVLENGDFDYQDEKLGNPLALKYFNLRSTFNHFILRTHINYELNKRFSVGYQWNLRRFSEVDNYPVTMGAHNVTVRWNLIQRSKDKIEVN